jgi:hypothetical protein
VKYFPFVTLLTPARSKAGVQSSRPFFARVRRSSRRQKEIAELSPKFAVIIWQLPMYIL